MDGESGTEVMWPWIASFHACDLVTLRARFIELKKKKKKQSSSDEKTKSLTVYETVGITHKEKKHFHWL